MAMRLNKYKLPSFAGSGPILLIPLVVGVFLISFTLGRYPLSFSVFIKVFASKIFNITKDWDPTVETVIFMIRLPRVLAAALIGGALSLAGVSYQGLFKNPMVSPDILGASAGAGFGAAVAILLSFNLVGIQLFAFVFSLGAVSLTLVVSKMISRGNNVTLALVLTGMVVAAMFSALTAITKYVADPESKLPEITFWLMGGLSSAGMEDMPLLFSLLAAGSIPLLLSRWRLNVLSFGDEEAQALGVDVSRLRISIIICSTLLTAACVSVCGLVGWIGLVIPHMGRLIVGPNFKVLLPASTLMGAIFLMLVDDVSRCAFPVEVPLGILTSLIGAPFFLYLLARGKKGWI